MEMHSASCSSERGKAEGTSSLSPPAMIFVADVHGRQQCHRIRAKSDPGNALDTVASYVHGING